MMNPLFHRLGERPPRAARRPSSDDRLILLRNPFSCHCDSVKKQSIAVESGLVFVGDVEEQKEGAGLPGRQCFEQDGVQAGIRSTDRVRTPATAGGGFLGRSVWLCYDGFRAGDGGGALWRRLWLLES